MRQTTLRVVLQKEGKRCHPSRFVSQAQSLRTDSKRTRAPGERKGGTMFVPDFMITTPATHTLAPWKCLMVL